MKSHLILLLVAVGLAGCSTCCKPGWFHHESAPAPPPPPPVTNAYLLSAHPLTPCNSCPTPLNGLPPSVPPNRPMPSGDNSVRLTIPEPSPAEAARQGVRLFPPQGSGVQPAVAEERGGGSPSPSLPVIQQFVYVKDKVASGLKPTQEGVDWLNANGYVAVLYLRAPGTDDSAERRRIENTRAVKYISLEVSPQTLSKEVVDQFNKIAGDAANQPLFVYDNDGILAGGLWYLYFRLVANLPDEKARREAGRLGLRETGGDDEIAMWLAVQKYLASQK